VDQWAPGLDPAAGAGMTGREIFAYTYLTIGVRRCNDLRSPNDGCDGSQGVWQLESDRGMSVAGEGRARSVCPDIVDGWARALWAPRVLSCCFADPTSLFASGFSAHEPHPASSSPVRWPGRPGAKETHAGKRHKSTAKSAQPLALVLRAASAQRRVASRGLNSLSE